MHDEFVKFVKKAMSVFGGKEGHHTHEKPDIEHHINYFDVMNTSTLTGGSQAARDKVFLMKNSMKEEMSAFITETSFTALTQIYKANSLWKRLLWTALVLAMIVYMGIQCYWLLDRYYSYPIEVKLDLKASRVLEFPSVTICNLNPIKVNSVKQDPYRPLEPFANPNMHDLLFQATVDNWDNQGQCKSDQITCDNGRCLHESFRCNGKADCCNGEDEHGCENYPCKVYQWKCTSVPKCIFMDQRCNGIGGECMASSDEDEADCHNNTCPEEFFRCSTGFCIPWEHLCDENVHCADDQTNCSVNAGTANDGSESHTKDDTAHSPSPMASTTTPPVSQAGISTSTVATTNNSRKKRAAIFRLLMEEQNDDDIYSKDEQDLYDEMVDYLNRSKNNKKNSVVKYLRAIWRVVRDNLKKEESLDYLANQGSQTSMWTQVKGDRNTDAEADSKVLHRLKREGRPPTNFPTSTTNFELAMKAMVQNSTFNKWDYLPKLAVQSRFYEERDDEYDAAMTYAYITAKMNPSVVEMSGHQKQNFIAACDFAGYQCSPDNFTYFHNSKFGNCYIFNWMTPNSTKLQTRFPGPEHGLRLELFLDQKNYVANLATEAGVRVLIHKKGSMPFPEDEGVSVMPDRSTSIGIKQVYYTRLPPPHGVCGDKGQTTDYYNTTYGTDYSKLSCLKSCYQDIAIKFCNCAVPFYYVRNDMNVCNMTDKYIEHCVTTLPNNHTKSFDTCDKLCPLPCQETKYDLSVSMAQWPSDNYKPFLLSRLGQTNSLYKKIQDSFSEHEFTKLQIYFQDLIYEHVEQQKAYESMNLISDLGGQLGLWLGLSVITLGELCSFLFGVGRSLPLKCWGHKTAPSPANDFTPVRPITPATLHAMIEDMCPHAANYIPPDHATDKTCESISKI